ncbi:MarR family winged helix-turn-helix transcriptional regulator [Thalassospira marina]|uniref:MarR family transcriptional regulator n=1 Tax=Thalassospira marina TaxID=2048283 RepID=A0A2N3KGI3_9PROT|nr:MarR family winged helix-turn-helix transcriptional regulator [Thalassospira marina]AUG53171.1 MarR family transcriptional regulator [Thalassospira marina]PKR49630.1 MarR family transcriptional regulator [Thalassospira marina]
MPETTIGETLHTLLHAYKRALRQAYQQAEIPLAISHIRTLKGINSVPDCTPLALSTRTKHDKGQLTRLLKDLLAENLIEKHPHPDDKRSNILHLTPEGHQIMMRIKEVEEIAASRMATGLSPDEITDFNRLANIMSANLAE